MESTPNDNPNPFFALWANATEQSHGADRIRGIRIDPALTELWNAIDDIDREQFRRHFPMSTSYEVSRQSTSTKAPARFVRQYIETMFWSTSDESTESGGYPLEDNYGIADIAPETMQRIQDDCSRFWGSVESMGIDLDREALVDCDPVERAAFHFWLTRNGHGCGFWDGDWSEAVEDRLTKLAESFGQQWPYVGDDGMIYL